MGDFCPENVSKGIKVGCSGGRRERRDKGLGSAESTGTKQQVNLKTNIAKGTTDPRVEFILPK